MQISYFLLDNKTLNQKGSLHGFMLKDLFDILDFVCVL